MLVMMGSVLLHPAVYLSRVTGTLYPLTDTFLVLLPLAPDNHCSTSMNLTIPNFTKGGAR